VTLSVVQPATHTVRLGRDFYARPAIDCAPSFLGKALVHETPRGRVAGIISDVEAYPAFADDVHHGNKRTARTEVMWGAPGRAYVYVVYGVWNQFAAVVNNEGVPDVVFVRAVVSIEGVEIMQRQWERQIPSGRLADSPGKLCKSLLITRRHYGSDLCVGRGLFLEDRGIAVPEQAIRRSARVGINPKRRGHDAPLRFRVDPRQLA
jgi:DNA-3-methyladenine glycosylase